VEGFHQTGDHRESRIQIETRSLSPGHGGRAPRGGAFPTGNCASAFCFLALGGDVMLPLLPFLFGYQLFCPALRG
jgi:hypothetical protein